MTVETEQSSEVYTGIVDGVPLNVPFPVQATTELKVRYDLDGVDTLATMGVHYTVALVPPEYLTATVTPLTGFAVISGGTVSVRREIEYTQPTDVPTLAKLASSRLEQMCDRLTFMCQQLRDKLVYSLQFPTTDIVATNIGVLPNAADRASKYLGFDSNGKPIAVEAAADTSVFTAFGIAWGQLINAAAGRAALSVSSTAEANALYVPKSLFTTIGDLVYGSAVGVASRLGIGSAGQVLGVAAGVPAWEQADVPAAQGRLTLATGVPVMVSDQTGKTVVYYSPYVGSLTPVYDGARFVPVRAAEVSNNITSAAANVGPVAAAPYSVYDFFLNAAGQLVRGPRWVKSAAFTVTIATPAVVTCAGHGLNDGATWRPTATTGNLPTGAQLVVGTDYFVSKIDANTFNVSTTLANQVARTYIATTGTQSGVHTGENYTTVRGTGAGTTELELLNGVYVNKNAITNGPAARLGTYVGSAYTNASSQIDFKLGSYAVEGGEAVIGIWNTYNRVSVDGFVVDTTNTWQYTTATWRPPRASPTMRASIVHGLNEEKFFGEYHSCSSNSGGGTSMSIGIGHDQSNATRVATLVSAPAAGYPVQMVVSDVFPFSGFRAVMPLENSQASNTTTWHGDNGEVFSYTKFRYSGYY